MTAPTLTNTAINAMLVGDELKDDRVPGLSVRANATGKSFMLYYRTKDGRQRRPKIGDTTVLSIAQAREIAKDMLAQVAAGRDPAGDRQKLRQEPDMDALWQRAEREHYNGGRRWDYDARRLYAANVKKRLGKTRVRGLTYEDVSAMHKAMRETPIEANRTLAVVSKMLDLAEKWGMRDLGTNPCRHVERFSERKRRRYASPDELKAIGAIMDRESHERPCQVAFLLLLFFTGARPSEIENGTPAMVQRIGDAGVLRLPEGKNGDPRDVYLPPQAVAILDRLPAHRRTLAGCSMTAARKLWNKIRAEAKCPDLWARDARRTFASIGFSGGLDKHTVGGLLGHRSVQTTNIYALLMEDPAHKAAAAVAERVEALLEAPARPR